MAITLKKHDWFHADGFPMAVERRDPQQPFGVHTHEFSELVIITGGRGLHVTGDDSWQLSAGDVFAIGGSMPHDYLNMDRLRLINVLFDQNELSLDLLDLSSLPGYHALFRLEPAYRKRHQFNSRLRLKPTEVATAIGFVDQLEDELQRRGPGFRFMATAMFMQLVGYLSRCYSQSNNADSRALLRIASSITHLETHYSESIHLEELVAMAKMSKRSFLRTFEAAMGCTPIAYLIQLRTTQAAKLLRQTDRSVTDIAYDVGFNDSNYFTRQFRKHFGMSPRTYRQRESLAHNA
ncbi:helix-turn-helix domain-containing protein [Aeoliella mucimassa]|uniref:HTH-type transcriptional activator RhaR n=1 Tax=Aeoliella mucimassa TaxID=2527972 RepID=A0A518AJB9_9BACT|nr:helix-turn-helix domain-containing protein [Aeoliella mucimassa]QDU54810.1 HTH-type transcriptional activator RhaR [Aeoliella mucimassa]